MMLRGGRYRAATQVKGLSPEIVIVSEADTVHEGAGRSLAADNGEVVRTRLGLRPWRDTKGRQYELGRANVFPERMQYQVYRRQDMSSWKWGYGKILYIGSRTIS